MTAAPAEHLGWWKSGERHLAEALDQLADEQFEAPSLLPGWSRRHLLAHVARNADALVNLLTWARTGVETPMYPSREARDEAILATAELPPSQLRTEVHDTAARLGQEMLSLPQSAWNMPVRTALGRTVPVSQVPWMRCREVWVHAVDLDAGIGFADIPEPVLAALVDDVFRMWDGRDGGADVAVLADGREWGAGTVRVAGSLPAVTGWLTGRSAGEDLTADRPLPATAAWL